MKDNHPIGIVLEGPKELHHAKVGFGLTAERSFVPEFNQQAAAGLIYLTEQAEALAQNLETQAGQTVGLNEIEPSAIRRITGTKYFQPTAITHDYDALIARGRSQFVEQGLATASYTIPDVFADGLIDGLHRIIDLPWRGRMRRGVRRTRAKAMLNELTPDRFL